MSEQIVIIEYDFITKESTHHKVEHGTPVKGMSLVFADGLCKAKNCSWCNVISRRILSRTQGMYV